MPNNREGHGSASMNKAGTHSSGRRRTDKKRGNETTTKD